MGNLNSTRTMKIALILLISALCSVSGQEIIRNGATTNRIPSSARFLIFGDSISEHPVGYGRTNWPYQMPGRSVVWDRAAADGQIFNYAVGGRTAAVVSNDVFVAMSTFTPQTNVVTYASVWVGINDFGLSALPLTVYNYLTNIYAQLQTNQIKVIAWRITPATTLNDWRIKALNDLISGSTNIDFCAQADRILPNPADATLFLDGTHPSPAGSVLLATELARLIEGRSEYRTRRLSVQGGLFGNNLLSIGSLTTSNNNAVATITGSGVSPGANLIADPSFEINGIGAGSWTFVHGAGQINLSASAHTGTKAVQLISGGAYSEECYQLITGLAGRVYQLSFWAKGDGVDGGTYYVYGNQYGNFILPLSHMLITNSSYAQQSILFTNPPGNTTIKVDIVSPATAAHAVIFDDVSVQLVDGTPIPLVLQAAIGQTNDLLQLQQNDGKRSFSVGVDGSSVTSGTVTATNGVYIFSPNGTRYKIKVSDGGVLSANAE